MPKILIVAPNWIGDTLLAQPLFARLTDLLAAPAEACSPVRIVIGRPLPCAQVANPSDALVDDVAFKLWREMAALAAAHAA